MMAERERERKQTTKKKPPSRCQKKSKYPGRNIWKISGENCVEKEKWKIVGFAIRKEVRHQSLVDYNQGVRGLNLWICMQNMEVIGIRKLVIQFTV